MVQIRNAATLAILHHAHVYQPLSAVHQTADQNAQYIQNALVTEPVLMLSAKTHAQDHVARQPCAAFIIIFPYVHALRDTLVIHLLAAE